MKRPKQSEVLPNPPAAFPKGWGPKASVIINGRPPKRGGSRPGSGRPRVELMCPWCGDYVPVSKRYHHGCMSLVNGKFRGQDLVAFYLRKAAIEMQKLSLPEFSYADYRHLLDVAKWYNRKAGESREKGFKNAKTTE